MLLLSFNLSVRVKIAYNYYFRCKVDNQDKYWDSHTVCGTCYSGLTQWPVGKRQRMPFGVPMVWREPKDHTSDCYYCLTKIKGFNKNVKGNIVYPDCESALKPVKHSYEIPVALPPTTWECDESESDIDKSDVAVGHASQRNTDFEFKDKSYLITLEEQNDFIRDLTNSKEKSEVLASRLGEWNLLNNGVRIASFRTRHARLAEYFREDDGICYCIHIDNLMQDLGTEHDPNEWELFIDSEKESLKFVLLHTGNVHPSVPLAHALRMNESYDCMETFLTLITYEEHQWNI